MPVLTLLASMPVWGVLAAVFAAALVAVLVATPLVRAGALRYGWVDIPDARKVHRRPIPAVGGVAIFVGFTVGLGLSYVLRDALPFAIPAHTGAIWLGALVLFAVGLYDDLRELSFRWKFAAQLGVAGAMVAAGVLVNVDGLPFLGSLAGPLQMVVAIPLTLLWIVGIINAVNLLDGLDGLAAGTGLIALCALAIAFASHGDVGMVVLAFALAGGILGFLVYNFNPASIFMGDSGSLVLGFVLAMYGLQGAGHVDPTLALLVPVMALGLPIMDTTVTFVRRIVQKRSPFMPDGDHIHHRMCRLVGSHRRAVVLLYGIGAVFAIAAVLVATGGRLRAAALVVGLLAFAYMVIRQLGYVRVTTSVRRLYVRRLLRRRARQRSDVPAEPRSRTPRTRPAEALAEAS